MFEISITILSRLLLVFIGYKLYRMFVGRGVVEQHVIGRRAKTIPGARRTQRGYMFLKRSRGKKPGETKFPMVDCDSNAPWGW